MLHKCPSWLDVAETLPAGMFYAAILLKVGSASAEYAGQSSLGCCCFVVRSRHKFLHLNPFL